MKKKLFFLSLVILAGTFASGQYKSFAVKFEQRVKADYQSLFNPQSSGEKVIYESSTQAIVHSLLAKDSTIILQIVISPSVASTQADSFWVKISSSDSSLLSVEIEKGKESFYNQQQSWIQQLAASILLNAPRICLNGMDGTYQFDQIIKAEKNKKTKQITHPRFRSYSNSKLQQVYQFFEWKTIYEAKSSYPDSFLLKESFQQFLGSKQLAAVGRKVEIVALAGTSFISNIENIEFNSISQTIDAGTRKRSINTQLLGTLSQDELEEELQQLDGENQENNFRLKSKIRAALFLHQDINWFQHLLKTHASNPQKMHLLTQALLEADIPYVSEYIAGRLGIYTSENEEITNLLIQISLYSSPTPEILNALFQFAKSQEFFEKSAELCIANLLYKIRDTDFKTYRTYSSELLQKYRQGDRIKEDTLQYMYLVANLGANEEIDLLQNLYHKKADWQSNIVGSLHYFTSKEADLLIDDYFSTRPMDIPLFLKVFENRKISAKLAAITIRQIMDADKLNELASISLIKRLLSRRWEDQLDLSLLLNHRYQHAEFQQEINAYTNSLFDLNE